MSLVVIQKITNDARKYCLVLFPSNIHGMPIDFQLSCPVDKATLMYVKFEKCVSLC